MAHILTNTSILCAERAILVALVIMNKYVNEDIILKLSIEHCHCLSILHWYLLLYRVNSTHLKTTLECLYNHTTGCSAVQGLPVFNKMFDIIATMTMKCSVLTKVVQNDQVLYQWDPIINSVHSFIYARTLFLTFAVLYQIASTKLLKDLKVCKGCLFYMPYWILISYVL